MSDSGSRAEMPQQQQNIVYRVAFAGGETLHTGYGPLAEIWAKAPGSKLETIALKDPDHEVRLVLTAGDAQINHLCDEFYEGTAARDWEAWAREAVGVIRRLAGRVEPRAKRQPARFPK